MKKYVYVLQYYKLNAGVHASLLSAFMEVSRLERNCISPEEMAAISLKLERSKPETKVSICDSYCLSRFELQGAQHV